MFCDRKMTVKPGKEIICENTNYLKLIVGIKGYCIYAFLNNYTFPEMCLDKGQGKIDNYPCYYIRLDDDYLPSLIFVIRFIQGREAVVLMRDRDLNFSKSRLLYTIYLDEFLLHFDKVQVVKKMTKTCEFMYPFKYDTSVDDDIIEKYVSKLSKRITQTHPIIEPETFSQPYWYNSYFWKDNRTHTQEPATRSCLTPEEEEEREEELKRERKEREKKERIRRRKVMREHEESEKQKRKAEEDYHKRRQQEIKRFNEAPKLDMQTGKISYPKPFDIVGDGRHRAIIFKRKDTGINTNLHDFPDEQTVLDLDLDDSSILAQRNPHKTHKKIPQPTTQKHKTTMTKRRDIKTTQQPRTTKLVRDRVNANKRKVDIAVGPSKVFDSDSSDSSELVEIKYGHLQLSDEPQSSSAYAHELDDESVIFEEEEEPQSENESQKVPRYVKPPPTMRIIDEDEYKRRTQTYIHSQTKPGLRKVSKQEQQKHAKPPRESTRKPPPAPKANKQSKKISQHQFLSPSNVDDSVLNL